MRVRSFELRLIAAGLTVLWTLVAGLVLLGYRPGGPIDLAVGLAAALPAVVAAAALLWPPAARGDRAFVLTVWLGLGVGLLLVPSIGGIIGQLVARGAQTLLPSLEAAYPWFLALAGTCLFASLGIVRRVLAVGAPRRTRLVRGLALAAVLTAACGFPFAGAAIANELALRDRPAVSSRFGPTNPALLPPPCDGTVAAGTSAQLSLGITGEIDLRPIGSVQINGVRSGGDVRWTAVVATDIALGRYGAARIGNEAWQLESRGGWFSVPAGQIDPLTVDRWAIEVALTPGYRAAAEDRGIEFVEGARARHCRIAIDGSTFRRAFPQVRWLVGEADLRSWRGQLDFWVFTDGQVGRLAATGNGAASGLPGTGLVGAGLQGTVQITMTATDRGQPVVVARPV
ncbi:MAG TPA: hypothetical protein VEO91_02390 [Candidatus Limnocylindria bacterium]|nr:hypothetical protein [Candidatus Limnocylindria bacterium]